MISRQSHEFSYATCLEILCSQIQSQNLENLQQSMLLKHFVTMEFHKELLLKAMLVHLFSHTVLIRSDYWVALPSQFRLGQMLYFIKHLYVALDNHSPRKFHTTIRLVFYDQQRELRILHCRWGGSQHNMPCYINMVHS